MQPHALLVLGQRGVSASPQTLAAVRVALAQPFADPVNVGGIPMRRAEARALERALSSKSQRVPSGSSVGAAHPLAVASTRPFPSTSPSVDDCAGGEVSPLPLAAGAFSHIPHDGLDAEKGQPDHV